MAGQEDKAEVPIITYNNSSGRIFTGALEKLSVGYEGSSNYLKEEFPEINIKISGEIISDHQARLSPTDIDSWNKTLDLLKEYEDADPGSLLANTIFGIAYVTFFIASLVLLPFVMALAVLAAATVPFLAATLSKANKSDQRTWLKRQFESTVWEVSDLNGGELNQHVKEKLQQKYPDCLFSFVKDPPKMDPPKMSYRQPLEVSDLANTTMLPNFFTKHPPLLNGKGIGARANLSEKLQSQVSNSKRTR